MSRFLFSRISATRHNQRSRSRRIAANAECLESRNLLTGVVQSGVFVFVTPASTGPNTAVVSYQSVNGVAKLDVNLNGVNNYFTQSQIGYVYYEGSGASGSQTFQNLTSVMTEAWGGSGSNLFEGGSREDVFFGGSGTNTFDAGTGFDEMIGGAGTNVYNENSAGSGVIITEGTSNTINTPTSSTSPVGYHVS
jgi:Ca2+-binding RTX toxin-like protein